MKVNKTHELDVEVEITELDVYHFLRRKAYSRLGENDPLDDPSVSGPHVFKAGESRWYWGKDEKAAQYIRAARMLRGWGDPHVDITEWAYLDEEENILLRRPTREQLLADRDAYPDAEIAAFGADGNLIINPRS